MSSYAERDAWFKNIKDTFHWQLEENVAANVNVFQVPKSLSSVAPEAYAPQMVGLGPCHHLRPEVRAMEGVKLDATRRFFKETKHGNFSGLTGKLSELDQKVRACYRMFLELNAIQLAWIMAVDSSFLFDFLCRHSIGKTTLKSSEWPQNLANPIGRKPAEDAILRDVLMLENQIPFFFMEEMLKLSTLDDDEQRRFVNDIFPQILVAFCKALSPIKKINTYLLAPALEHAHLLDLLYHMIVPHMVVPQGDESRIVIHEEVVSTKTVTATKETGSSTLTHIKRLCDSYGPKVLGAVKNLNLPVVQSFAEMAKHLLALPLSDLTNALSNFLQEAPVADNTLIPRASNLAKAGIKFCLTETIMDIQFDESKAMLHLPVIQVGVNTEVIICNLVAYEATAMSNSLIFARYVELMSGLINTMEDVKLLRDSNILISRMKDNDVASIFNGAIKSIKSTSNIQAGEMITSVRKVYNDSWNTKVRMLMRMSNHRFWKILALLAILLYMLLVGLQSFCSAYNCARLYRTGSST
ncbi:putative UPF0481 protein At3g02645 [Eucalyptus grandis]|nr:putative UPF0481 protein At3g02645 [Eucalyptus grandis]